MMLLEGFLLEPLAAVMASFGSLREQVLLIVFG